MASCDGALTMVALREVVYLGLIQVEAEVEIEVSVEMRPVC